MGRRNEASVARLLLGAKADDSCHNCVHFISANCPDDSPRLFKRLGHFRKCPKQPETSFGSARIPAMESLIVGILVMVVVWLVAKQNGRTGERERLDELESAVSRLDARLGTL